ncbi:MAG: hypothetical protein IPP37_09220 [Saprospiraceae bacterium]|nr:hypothetical protein [Saprospiraceae bacterium]
MEVRGSHHGLVSIPALWSRIYLFFNFVFRIYWGFAGNKYANWKQFIPTTKHFEGVKNGTKMDILLMKGNKEERSTSP